MNRVLLFTLAIFTIQLASCKKEEVINTPIYTVREYRNSQLFKKYVYSPNRFARHKLLHYYSFNNNGSITDSVQFFYSGNRLDSLYTYSYPSGEKYLTKYEYEYDQIISIDKWYSHNYNVKFNMNYSPMYEKFRADYYTSSQPSSGVLFLSREGNVAEHHNEYVASIFNENFESNLFTYNQNYNVLSPFWVMDPTSFSLSNNLVVGHSRMTRSTNGSISDPNAQWYYSFNKWDFEYTYYTDGNVMTKTVLDTNQLVVDFYEYEYTTN